MGHIDLQEGLSLVFAWPALRRHPRDAATRMPQGTILLPNPAFLVRSARYPHKHSLQITIL